VSRAKRPKSRAILLELVDWLLAHEDQSGLSSVLHNHLDVGTFVNAVWPDDGVRALFAVINDHAPLAQLRDIIEGAKSCQADIITVEKTQQAAKLLGVEYEDVEKMLAARKAAHS
jgi:hypothetical protein